MKMKATGRSKAKWTGSTGDCFLASQPPQQELAGVARVAAACKVRNMVTAPGMDFIGTIEQGPTKTDFDAAIRALGVADLKPEVVLLQGRPMETVRELGKVGKPVLVIGKPNLMGYMIELIDMAIHIPVLLRTGVTGKYQYHVAVLAKDMVSGARWRSLMRDATKDSYRPKLLSVVSDPEDEKLQELATLYAEYMQDITFGDHYPMEWQGLDTGPEDEDPEHMVLPSGPMPKEEKISSDSIRKQVICTNDRYRDGVVAALLDHKDVLRHPRTAKVKDISHQIQLTDHHQSVCRYSVAEFSREDENLHGKTLGRIGI